LNSCSFSILSFNHPDLTAKAVRSVLPFNAPVVLIHNGTDNKHYMRLKTQFPEINHVRIEANIGFSGGANVALSEGLKLAPHTFFITNDCELRSFPASFFEVGIIVPKIMIRHTNKVHSIGGIFNPDSMELHHCHNVEDFSKGRARKMSYVPGTAFIIDRKTFADIGKFDVTLGTYWEDVDWSVRAQRLGVQLHVAENVVLSHGVGKTCHKDSQYTIFLFHRNARRVGWRYSRNKFYFAFSYMRFIGSRWLRLLTQRRWSDISLLARACFN
jgi:GT2 family glycosyltransferase